MKRFTLFMLGLFALLNTVSTVQAANADSGYQQPSQEIIDIVDAPPAPAASVSPNGSVLLVADYPSLPSIEDLAAPELRLAGRRINPDNLTMSQPRFIKGLRFVDVASGDSISIRGLPENLKALYPSWSPDGTQIAFIQLFNDRAELWRIDLERKRAQRWSRLPVNAIWGNPVQWGPDNRHAYVLIAPENRGNAPVASNVPTGPVITESRGRTAPARTYQDLLEDEYDEKLFDYYFQGQLVRMNLRGRIEEVGEAGIIADFSLAPNGLYLLVERIQRPYSYAVPHYRFPRLTEVWNLEGDAIYEVANQPLADNLPIAFDAVVNTPRSASWRTDADATLVWAEAQDGGDPNQEAEVRDIVYQLGAPFSAEPSVLAELSMRYGGLMAGNNQVALVLERMWRDREEKLWRVSPAGAHVPQLVWERSWEDRYNDPGRPVMTQNEQGRTVLLLDGEHILLTGDGASDEGERPFIDKRHLATGETERLWRSEAPFYEVPQSVIDYGSMKFLTRREGVDTPPDFFVRDLANNELTALTETPHPMPHTLGISRELIHYEREDGLAMSATLFLPAGYNAEEDGPLPTIIWAYPREFRSNAAAAQVSGSPYEFNRISYWRPQYLATQGYAVLDNATMPIVGEGDQLPNDTFIEQLEMNSKAAIQAGVSRGVTDPNRVAIGGHSYGAFMTANVLAHTNLFKAGIARSGAYNRSLTPFGFQREERTVWDDSDLYIRMSPFFAAHQIKTPLLMIHGTDDNNSGTFPMQSERLFHAVKGLGGTVRLVMLPLESHGYRARESVLHMLWEQTNWLDEFVKNAESE